jgi:polyhydroxybutyrate depolymerase
VNHVRRNGLRASSGVTSSGVTSSRVTFAPGLAALPLVALLGCAGASDGEEDVARFQGQSASPAPSPNAGTQPAGTPPPAAPAGNPNTSGNEATPPTAALDPGAVGAAPGGAAPADNAGAAPTDPGTGATPPDPAAPPLAAGSAGCGLAQGAPQNPTLDAGIIFFPPGYDGSTPTPLVLAFHGANRTNVQMRIEDSRTADGVLEQNYVVAYLKSAGTAWDLNTDYPRFDAALQAIEQQYCIDTTSVFAFGHSSGAQFIAQMLGARQEARFAGVVPVSSSRFQNPSWAPVPTFAIHGLQDTARPQDPDGADDIIQYTESNQCSGGSQPVNVPQCNSLAGGVAVSPGCRQYDGCAAPVLFCNHNDPNYLDNGNPTNHGWPCFANEQIFAFYESLR